ncbi:hypothetical protein ARMGADRAFT_1003824 [Armillaria gallica]|uniref:Uncharacterized protein n=1 Tax=Armillaria gallica TaxID=47427 RepID=A0A2H3CCH1_ARMGA|nr:hypothetical protein ARMGADRAFT_1003824 [Armillaria gallica]
MVNIIGKNGSDCGIRPPDDILEKALREYSAECLPVKKRLSRLEAQYGYRIGKTKLNDLNNHFGIMSSRKTGKVMSQSVATSLVIDKLEEDIHNRNGPDSVKTFLAQDGFNIPRDMIRQGLKAHNIHGGAQRAPSKYRQKIHRTPLYSIGVGAEFNCDGHEKLSSQALRMGRVGIAVYEFRDKASGRVIKLVAVPNARDSNTIGHLYLDVVSVCFVLSGFLTRNTRTNLAPDVDTTAWPPFVALTSINNIIAEALWHWMRKTNTGDIERIIKLGRTNGIFIPASELHADLFQWLWSKIVQHHLDEFTQYWNAHRIRKQDKKLLPSGSTPNDVYFNPSAYDLERVSIPVEKELIDGLRAEIPVSREDCLRWVSKDFDEMAAWAYQSIGSPALVAKEGWHIFARMVTLLTPYYPL